MVLPNYNRNIWIWGAFLKTIEIDLPRCGGAYWAKAGSTVGFTSFPDRLYPLGNTKSKLE